MFDKEWKKNGWDDEFLLSQDLLYCIFGVKHMIIFPWFRRSVTNQTSTTTSSLSFHIPTWCWNDGFYNKNMPVNNSKNFWRTNKQTKSLLPSAWCRMKKMAAHRLIIKSPIQTWSFKISCCCSMCLCVVWLSLGWIVRVISLQRFSNVIRHMVPKTKLSQLCTGKKYVKKKKWYGPWTALTETVHFCQNQTRKENTDPSQLCLQLCANCMVLD